MTILFKNETPIGEVVTADLDTKYSGKSEKVDPTTEALWEVEWYALRRSLRVSYLTRPFGFSGASHPQKRIRPGKGTGSCIKRAP